MDSICYACESVARTSTSSDVGTIRQPPMSFRTCLIVQALCDFFRSFGIGTRTVLVCPLIGRTRLPALSRGHRCRLFCGSGRRYESQRPPRRLKFEQFFKVTNIVAHHYPAMPVQTFLRSSLSSWHQHLKQRAATIG